jgi:hypothetical protein
MSGRTSAAEVVEMLYEHRLLSTRQVHLWHRPDGSLRSVQRTLKSLADDGLVASSRRGVTGEAVWWATAAGARSAKAGGSRKRSYQVTAEIARGPLRQHTLDTNEVGIAFVQAARAQGGWESGTVTWEHEVEYRVAERARGGQRADGDSVTPDAVLRFTAVWPNESLENLAFFIEVDRGNKNYPDVVKQIGAYYRLLRYNPKQGRGWRDEFEFFPRLLVVLTGKSERVLINRRHQLLYFCTADPAMTKAREAGWKAEVAIVHLTDLIERGPMAPIFWEPGTAGRVDCVGQSVDEDTPTVTDSNQV